MGEDVIDKCHVGKLGGSPLEVKDQLWALASPDSGTLPLPHPPALTFTWHKVSSLCLSASSVASRASFWSSSWVGGVVMSRK